MVDQSNADLFSRPQLQLDVESINALLRVAQAQQQQKCFIPSFEINDTVYTAPSEGNCSLQFHLIQQNLSIVNFVQGGFIFSNIVFGCNDPTYYPSPGRGIGFAHSVFRSLHACRTLVFVRSIARGLANLG